MILGAAAEPPGAQAQRWPATAEIRFHGTSTLHDFSGQVAAQPFILTIASNTWSAQGMVVAGNMTTAHEGRDKNMWRMFATNEHPALRGEVKPTPLPPASTNANLVLQIRKQQQEIPARITDWKEDAEAVRFHAEWDISLKQYGLKPPSVMGVIRVGDRVRVTAEVTARKIPLTTNAPPVNPAAKP